MLQILLLLALNGTFFPLDLLQQLLGCIWEPAHLENLVTLNPAFRETQQLHTALILLLHLQGMLAAQMQVQLTQVLFNLPIVKVTIGAFRTC